MSAPACSVVVPTRDRARLLRAALDALLVQEPPGFAEVLVVDDGSRDETAAILAEPASSGKIVVLRTAGRGPAAARNAGIRAARAPVVACTDDDCLPPRDWAARLAARLAETGAAAVGGRVVAPLDAPLHARLSQAITNGFVAALNEDPTDAVFLTSNNVAYRLSTLREAGLFDEAFAAPGGEDRELHLRLRARGGRLCYAPDVVVGHRPAMSWTAFLRQQAAYGRGARMLRLRASRLGASASFPPHAYLSAFAAALAEVRPRDRPFLLMALAASQAAVAWGYARPVAGR